MTKNILELIRSKFLEKYGHDFFRGEAAKRLERELAYSEDEQVLPEENRVFSLRIEVEAMRRELRKIVPKPSTRYM